MHQACVLEVLAWGDGPPDVAEAWRAYEAIHRRGTPITANVYWDFNVAAVLARAGERDSARAVLERTREPGRAATITPATRFWLEAAVRFRLGETERARRLIDEYLQSADEQVGSVLAQRALRDYVVYLLPDRPG